MPVDPSPYPKGGVMEIIDTIIALDESMCDCEVTITDVNRIHGTISPEVEIISINSVPAKWLTKDAINEALSQTRTCGEVMDRAGMWLDHDGDEIDRQYERRTA